MVGAGILGLSTAYLLRRGGLSVVLLDDGLIAGGQTAATSAHLTSELDARYGEIERLHGQLGARQAAESHEAAITRIEQIVREEEIDCDFRRVDGFLFAADALPSGTPREIAEEHDAARRAGLDVEIVRRAPVPSFDTGACLRVPHQARFEPLRYALGLARAFERAGGRLFTDTHVTALHGGDDARVTTAGGHEVSCGAVVVATHSPINDRFVMHTKQAPYMTYIVAARVPRGSVPDVLLWDTADPYHYVRIRPAADPASGFDHVLVGGEDHKTGQAHDGVERFARLELWAQQRFPGIQAIDRRWAGEVLEPSDGLGYIGRNPGDASNVYIGTGFSGNGLTHGTVGGMLLTDLIAGRANPWQALYDPSRIRLGAAADLLRENLNVATQYASWLAPGAAVDESAIPPGGGTVVRHGLERLAVHRDPSGALHRMKAACPHLGCLVAWNDVEKTWDCPCHGSRFAATGRVIVGPANQDLAPVERAEESAHGEQEQV